MAVFEFDGLAVEYSVSGEGTPVLFMHGLGADRSQAHTALASCIEHAPLKLVTVDMPGHGASPAPSAHGEQPARIGFKPYCNLGFALLDYLGIDEVLLGGISMGAGIATTMALMQPERVSGLYLSRPAWLAEPARPHLNIVSQMGELLDSCTPEQAREQLSNTRNFQCLFAGIPAAAQSVLQLTRHPRIVSNPWVLKTMVADQPVARLEDLAQINCPALVIGNKADPLHPLRLAR